MTHGRLTPGGKSPRIILHVTECYEGGVSRAIRNIVRLMPMDKHLLLGSGMDIATDTRLFDMTENLPHNPMSAVKKIRTVIRSLKPDVVHAHSSWGGFYTRLIPLNRPVVYQPHCYAFEDITRPGPVRAIFWIAEYFASYRTASVLALSPHEMTLANKLNSSTTVHSVPNVPTLPVLERTGTEQQLSRRSVYMIGRAAPQKDPRYFTEVVEEIRQILNDVEFVWIGDGEPKYLGLLERHGVRVTGWLEREEIAQELRCAGVYVHSAGYEGFPLSVLDAASQGVPVVTRDIACFEGTPLLQMDSARQMAMKTVELLTDPKKRASVIARGYELLDHMNEPNQVKALDHAYEECRSR